MEFGGAERDRTAGLLVANEALSQLSYSPTEMTFLVYQRNSVWWKGANRELWREGRKGADAFVCAHLRSRMASSASDTWQLFRPISITPWPVTSSTTCDGIWNPSTFAYWT